MDKLPLVVAIPTKNEAENIARTVSSVIGHVQAVVVVDSHSTDDTCKIAAELGAETVDYTWDGRYPKKKQWCLDHVHPEIPWLLFLDGDETPAPNSSASCGRCSRPARRRSRPSTSRSATGSPGAGCGTATPSSNAP